MTPERKGLEPIWRGIEKETAKVPIDETEALDKPTSEQAEELFALWRDLRSRTETEDTEKTDRIKKEIARRIRDPEVKQVFQEQVKRIIRERKEIKNSSRNYQALQASLGESVAERDHLYQEIFTHRDQEPDELSQLDLAETEAEIDIKTFALEDLKDESVELSRQLSFERIAEYRGQLQQTGFIWTPSREKLFEKMAEQMVIVNQNRPLLLTGETGTGKTRLARAAARRLTDRAPYEVGEEAKTDIRPLLGSPAVDEAGSYVIYGPLGQALSGKENSRQEKAERSGIFYMDELNGYPPDALRALIKQISGRRPGEEVSFAAWKGRTEQLAPDFAFVASANLPSEKHPDRADLPVEVARELTSVEVDYPPQTEDDPELYEMMLAALMDKNGRIRVPREELAPAWQEVVSDDGQLKRFELDNSPETGGTLWRFAQLTAEIQKSYKGEDNTLTPERGDASYLRHAVLDPGLVLNWLQAYRKSAMRREYASLKAFLSEKLDDWAEQKIYPEEDRALLEKFFDKYDLHDPDAITESQYEVLSPQEIGSLSPRVPREALRLERAVEPGEKSVFLPDGTEVLYHSTDEFPGGMRVVEKSDPDTSYTIKGLALPDKREVILEDEHGGISLTGIREFAREYEKQALVFTETHEGQEISLDLMKAREATEAFLREHNLTELADVLPRDIRLSRESEARIREALKQGFDQALVLPETRLQAEFIPDKLKALAEGYENSPFWAGGVSKTEIQNRPDTAYILLYSSGDVPRETKDLTFPDAKQLFQRKGWNGLTLPEYLIAQKMEYDRRKDHSFDAYSSDADKSNWTWLLDQVTLDDQGQPSRALGAGWFPGHRRVGVYRYDREYRSGKLGARPSVVVEII